MICSLSMPVRDDSWLSLTPEPERLLPEARAVLFSGQAPPPPALLTAERRAAERLVLRGRRARWEAWLRDSAALAERRGAGMSPLPDGADDPTAATVALVRDVVANHDALALGLPGERRNRRR
jgi:hypothetical protein